MFSNNVSCVFMCRMSLKEGGARLKRSVNLDTGVISRNGFLMMFLNKDNDDV